ncbi:MAG: pyridoxal 5'-phosphate synthase glutaminase subunit PdxT [Candidatus Zixiibacteriota bacterium]
MYSHLNIGVLALQGDFAKHLEHLKMLRVSTREIRQKKDIEGLDGIIIPGGESTTMSDLLDRFGMRECLTEFCRLKPVWGTCAGMIMLAREVADDARIRPLSIIDIVVERNGYGRQVHSFFSEIKAELDGIETILKASFIRAPIVKSYASDIKVLSSFHNSPVLLFKENCLVSSFHTELSDDATLTRYFLDRFVLSNENRLKRV